MDLLQKPREPRALVLESVTDVAEHCLIWELVVQGTDLSLEALFLRSGGDPAGDASIGDDGLFRFLDGQWQVVDSSGHPDTREVISSVTRVLNGIVSFLAQ